MSSKIEQQIDQIEDYIDSCRYQKFSKTNIIVDKDELDGLLEELRARTPEEIKHYQRIISNKEAILEDARRKAEELINEATIQTNELVSEHEIMQQAYAQADQIVRLAQQQAQEIVDRAVVEANAYRSSASQYMDDMLGTLEDNTTQSLESLTAIFANFHNSLSGYIETIRQNRTELGRCGYYALYAMLGSVAIAKNLLRPALIIRGSTAVCRPRIATKHPDNQKSVLSVNPQMYNQFVKTSL